ncbi:CbiQ family ECF transporter T component [Acaryochloris sp. IP29b_bin.148]|uniref:energy-coupling factor transporter transmembrane component T family protein n=1 Tax=Acaryochloris sp. IP29b_bin.148 TaxID=2969218 RepID=UPI002604C770|nr:CbiQ family ECF transporter T component [Acaryochloris sp. IP29b_bin.148]
MDLLRSLPIGSYLEQPRTWLHRLDPRVKLAWLMMFLLTPMLADLPWRIAMVLGLILLTLFAGIPFRVWRKQMVWLLLLGVLVGGITALMPDGLAISYQPRLPARELTFTQQSAPPTFKKQPWYRPLLFWQSNQTPHPTSEPLPPSPPTVYRYVLFHKGPVRITRRSLELGLRFGTWLFTLIYSTNLYLLTTAPEEITVAIDRLLQPLKRWRIPITEVTLTLTLSLRFIPLVLEEIQNLIRAIRTRAINWKKLGVRGAIQLWLLLADRLIENLFLRAEQVASAMMVRGFTSPNHHQVKWHQLHIHALDRFALVLVVLLCGVRIWVGTFP